MSIDATNPFLLVALAVKANVPVVLYGPGGCGKTAMMPTIAKMLGFLPADDMGGHANRIGYVSTSAAFLEREDIGGLGIPTKMDDGTRVLERLIDKYLMLAVKHACLLVIDELPRACNDAVLNVLLRVLQERMVGEHPLHEGTRIVCTGNAANSDGSRELISVAANRVCMLEYIPAPSTTIDYFRKGRKGGGHTPNIPSFDDEAIAHATSASEQVVAAFLDCRQTLVNKEPKDTEMTDKPWGRAICGPWPSSRSWSNTIDCMGVVASLGDVRSPGYAEAFYALAQGLVGPGPALELFTFLTKMDMRSGSECLDTPYTCPKRIDVLWAEVMSAMSEATRRGTQQATEAAFYIMGVCQTGGFPEVASIAFPMILKDSTGKINPYVQGALKKNPSLQSVLMTVAAYTKVYTGGAQ